LKPEWWGSPLAQEEKYQGEERKPVTRDDDDDDNNNNNKFHLRFVHSTVVFLHPKLSFAICLCL
jgi:hypothetical protein